MSKKKIKILVHKTINSRIQRGYLIAVSHGYANNYLLPQRIASIATDTIIQQFYQNEQIQKQKNVAELNKFNTTKQLFEKIHKFTLKRRVDLDYRFFGSIGPTNITKTILHRTNIRIDKKQTQLPQIRKIGRYIGTIQSFNNLTVDLVIQVLPINNI
uniref:50S ribosomal protein L9, chloroplastic n=1 Tax=Hildenbrandia rivularis TaxID=135206 RepID=A0A1C9CFN8_9FLOR|nr:ribosomal protein L9 [Hildenbrandia rivularis]AOM67184.1 ribosomal protein L9 [Hildenbrandia rivularis]